MVDILFPGISTDTSHVSRYFRDTPAPTASVLYQEFMQAQQFGSEAVSSVGGYLHSQLFDETSLSADEYKESKYYREGISVPADGIKESVAESLAEAYDRRFKRNLVLSRARSGMGLSAARFGANIVGSVLDPINVGVGVFAPVAVGLSATARAAAIRATAGITQRYGVTAGRVAAGAGEAALGGALFEASVAYPGARIQQDPEYGLMDAFINVTIGSVLGGTVTGVGGKFSDVLRRGKPETIIQAEQVAINQLVEGAPVRVDAVLNADEAISPSLRAEKTVKRRRLEADRTAVKPPRSNELPPSLKATNNTPETLIGFVQKNGRIDPDSIGVADIKQRMQGFTVTKKGGKTVEQMAEAAQEAGFFPGRVDTYDDKVGLYEFVEALENRVYSDIDPEAIAKAEADALYEQVSELGINPRGMTDEELFEEIVRRGDEILNEERLEQERGQGAGLTREELDAEISRVEQDYESGGGLSEYANALAEVRLLADDFEVRMQDDDSRIISLDREIDVLERQAGALRANEVLTDAEIEELAEWDAVLSRSDEMIEIAEAGAYCVMRPSNV
jgi:hypothetical protein